jgi:integrase
MGVIVCPFCRSILIGADSVPDNTVDSIKLRDGEVVLYKRKASNRWQARFKLPDNTWHRITTKRTSIDEASRIATEAYDQARFMHKAGINVVSRRFRDVAELAIKQMDTETDNGVGKVIYKDYKQAINTYLIPYFGNKQVDAIAQDDVTRFDAWRTQEMKRKPAASTIMNHNAALHRVFDTAIAHGWMLQKSIPILKNKGKKSNRRPDFTMQDWKRVTANLPHWIKKADNDRTRHMRELLQDYVLILSNTGIRTGTEAQNIKWKHLRWDKDEDGERVLMIVVDGKTKQRELVARHGCAVFFARIQSRFPDLAKMTFDELLKKRVDEFVFRLRDTIDDDGKVIKGKQTKNLYHTFNQFLTEFNLLEDSQGNHRTLYSLRHTYATMRLTKDRLTDHQLGKQLGTSAQMIDKHYSHLEPRLMAKVLAGKRYESKPAKKPTTSAKPAKSKTSNLSK